MALTTVSSDRLSTNVKNTNFTAAEKQDLTNDILPLAGQLGNRNLIINGAMQVAQRGTTSTTNGFGSVDRFPVFSQGTDEAPTHAQVEVVSSDSGDNPFAKGFSNCMRITNGNQTSGAGGGDLIAISYPVEAQDIRTSGWNYNSSSSFVTLSFYVKSSVAQNFYVMLRSEDGTQRAYVIETGSLTANTWTKITKTIPGNSNLQFDNNTARGLLIEFVLFRGTDGTGSVTLNQWATYSSSARVPNMTSTWYTTNDATFEITGVQLEVGSTATDFEHRSFGQELALCQRYYFKVGYGTQYVSVLVGIMASSTDFRCTGRWPVPMRVAPTITQSGLEVDSETAASVAITGLTSSYLDPYSGRLQFSTNSASFGAGQAAQAYTSNTTSFLAGSAEL